MLDQTPNSLATLALSLWPLAAWALVRALGPARGLVAGLVAAYLILPPAPAGLDLPLLPPLTKDTIPGLAALAACWLARPPGLRLLPGHPAARALLAVLVAAPFLTVLANPDPLAWGPVSLPGLSIKEAAGVVIYQLLALAPFLLARALLASEAGARDALWAVLWGGLAYSLPMLIEVRLSPQLNIWVYGFFQHSFEQMMRGDGFRPIVFLYHGLWAAFFAMTACLAACALLRDRAGGEGGRRAVALGLAAAWMLLVVALCKSSASLLYALGAAPLILLLGPRAQLRVAACLAVLALLYPAAKVARAVPQDAIVALAERAAPERANSLRFRFDNEDMLLARAEERPLLGWGLWGRNLVHDPATGRVLSIPDGQWIIALGTFGWLGLLGQFGLLALPVLLAWRRAGPEPPPAVAALALILAVNLVDLMPNATLTPVTWLMAGALLGWAERARVKAPVAAGRAAPAPAFGTVL